MTTKNVYTVKNNDLMLKTKRWNGLWCCYNKASIGFAYS